MKLRSITDVITNSSTEVFCYKINDPEYQEIKKDVPWLPWTEFKTEDDIKNLVMDPDYWGLPWAGGVQCDHGPEEALPIYDIMANYEVRETLKGKKTPDEIWEFVKEFYIEGLIGKAVSSFENDCISHDQYQEMNNFLNRKYSEKLEKHLSQFVPGDILEVDLRSPLKNGNKTVLIKKVADKKYDIVKESWESTGIFKYYSPEIVSKSNWIYLVELLTARKYENKEQS
jgi:hypothetical protein